MKSHKYLGRNMIILRKEPFVYHHESGLADSRTGLLERDIRIFGIEIYRLLADGDRT